MTLLTFCSGVLAGAVLGLAAAWNVAKHERRRADIAEERAADHEEWSEYWQAIALRTPRQNLSWDGQPLFVATLDSLLGTTVEER